jgi:hypothetical protein
VSDPRLTLIVNLWLKEPDIAAFEAFERQAAVAATVTFDVVQLVQVARCSGISMTLSFLGFPWAITAPLCIALLAVALRGKREIR